LSCGSGWKVAAILTMAAIMAPLPDYHVRLSTLFLRQRIRAFFREEISLVIFQRKIEKMFFKSAKRP
jgi:hypothetical protein